MAGSIDQNKDGSIALYINDDLQFDSKDEHIYHEGLVLPALCLAIKRLNSALNVLIIGGGDGLVARELFKSDSIKKVDLVDYDSEILNYARINFADLNKSSLSDPRLQIHIKDAWSFVEEAVKSETKYDLIISDLTVPDDINSARFHSVEWYSQLSALLNSTGMLAVNGVSALATPEAFWCVSNSISKARLHVRPYHVQIPSFSAKGYGPDWAFFIASKEQILSDEIENNLVLTEPRNFIKDNGHLLQLFDFPQALFAYHSTSAPALAGSDILIHYFNNAKTCLTFEDPKNSFTFNINLDKIPAAYSGENILPPNFGSVLAQVTSIESTNPELVWQNILELMPSLQHQCPPELVSEFVENPAYFLEGIDLESLVTKLLKRARELPQQLVAELELLREKLQEWAGDHLSLFALGQRVVTILAVVIVIGNLLYPDSVYGKGEHAAASHHAAAGGAHRSSNRSGRYVNGNWVNDPYWNNGVNTRIIKQVVPAAPKNMGHTGNFKMITPPTKQTNTTGFLPNNPNIDQSSYMAILERNVEASMNRLQQTKKEIIFQKEILETELQQYNSSNDAIVTFGIHKIERVEAIRRLQQAIQKANNQIANLDMQISQIPSATELAKLAFANLQSLQVGINKDNGSELS